MAARMVAGASSKEFYQSLQRLCQHCKELKGIYLNLNIYGWNRLLSFDYAMFTGKDVTPPPQKKDYEAKMCVNVIQLYFQFLINNNKWIREHYSAHCALIKRFDSTAQESIDPHAPASVSSQKERVLSQFCAAALSQDASFFFFMLQTLWQPGRSWKESLIQHCLWWTESVHPWIQSTCSIVQSGCCSGEKKRKKKFITSISWTLMDAHIELL